MGSSPCSIVDVIIFLLFLQASCSAVAAFDGKLLSRICSGKQFTSWSQYDFAVTDVINDLISHTSKSPDLDYYCQDTRKAEVFMERDLTLYGHADCAENLAPDDCLKCIKYAYSEMFKECTHSIGAQIKLMDCRLRYENYKFNNDE